MLIPESEIFPEVHDWCAVPFGTHVIIWCILHALRADVRFPIARFIHPTTCVVSCGVFGIVSGASLCYSLCRTCSVRLEATKSSMGVIARSTFSKWKKNHFLM